MQDLSVDSAHFKRPCLAKRVRLQIDPVTGDPVLLNQEAVIVINRAGYEILERCDGTRTLPQIIEELEKQYAIVKATLTQDVSQYVKKLNQKGLLQWI
jgi:pyrroloquinoline quinone biosynthesis protein D